MILGFFFLFHFLEVLSGREGFFAKKGGVSLVRNRDLRPAAKANPTIQQAFERFQKYNRLKNLSQGSLDFYAAKGRSFFRFLGDTEQPIHTITEETVEDYIFYMKKSPESFGSTNDSGLLHAADGGRTRTLSPERDFKSLVSANFTTAAQPRLTKPCCPLA